MRSTGSWPRALMFVFALLVPQAVSGRPQGLSHSLSKIESLDLSGPASDFLPNPAMQVFRAASAGTTSFGGTVWAADSMRWEALENGTWTFDSGVGSSLIPVGGPSSLSAPTSSWVNPFKHSGLHATMEGWVGFDNTSLGTDGIRPAVMTGNWGVRPSTVLSFVAA